MSTSRRSFRRFAACLWLLALPGPVLAQTAQTPPAGSPERKAIVDAMRAKGDLPNRVFVVRRIRVANDWAWLDAEPQSADGKNRYEPESALLRRTSGRWAIVDQPCGEESCNRQKEIRRIRSAFPAAPATIFP